MTLHILHPPAPPRHPHDANRKARIVIIGAVYIMTAAFVAAAVTTAVRADRPHRAPAAAPARHRQPRPASLAGTTDRR